MDENTRIMDELTIKQEKFCNYYIELGNASEAYRRSYDCSGMKVPTINRKAHEMLKCENVSARISEMRANLSKKTSIEKDDAIAFLSSVIGVDPVDLYMTENGTFIVKSIEDIPRKVRMCIQSIKSSREGIEIRLYSKIAAITQMSKMLGWDAPIKSDVSTNVRMIIGDEE